MKIYNANINQAKKYELPHLKNQDESGYQFDGDKKKEGRPTNCSSNREECGFNQEVGMVYGPGKPTGYHLSQQQLESAPLKESALNNSLTDDQLKKSNGSKYGNGDGNFSQSMNNTSTSQKTAFSKVQARTSSVQNLDYRLLNHGSESFPTATDWNLQEPFQMAVNNPYQFYQEDNIKKNDPEEQSKNYKGQNQYSNAFRTKNEESPSNFDPYQANYGASQNWNHEGFNINMIGGIGLNYGEGIGGPNVVKNENYSYPPQMNPMGMGNNSIPYLVDNGGEMVQFSGCDNMIPLMQNPQFFLNSNLGFERNGMIFNGMNMNGEKGDDVPANDIGQNSGGDANMNFGDLHYLNNMNSFQNMGPNNSFLTSKQMKQSVAPYFLDQLMQFPPQNQEMLNFMVSNEKNEENYGGANQIVRDSNSIFYLNSSADSPNQMFAQSYPNTNNIHLPQSIPSSSDLYLTPKAMEKNPSNPNSAYQSTSKILQEYQFADLGLDSIKKIGRLTVEERRKRIEKYRLKRQRRNWKKKISYDCRKRVADHRIRIKGRFITKEQAMEILKMSGVHDTSNIDHRPLQQVKQINSNVTHLFNDEVRKDYSKENILNQQLQEVFKKPLPNASDNSKKVLKKKAIFETKKVTKTDEQYFEDGNHH